MQENDAFDCISENELENCISCLDKLAKIFKGPGSKIRRESFLKSSRFRGLRKSLGSASIQETITLRMFSGQGLSEKSISQYEIKRNLRRRAVAEEARRKAKDRTMIDNVKLRSGRIAKLNALLQNQPSETDTRYLTQPDGAIMEEEDHDNKKTFLLTNDGCNAKSKSNENGNNVLTLPQKHLQQTTSKLLACYTCKTRYSQLHHFYDRLCPSCAKLNYRKRFQEKNWKSTDIHVNPSKTNFTFSSSNIAIVTGGRIKIGFQTALKLLHLGCTVIVTTRFPFDAFLRYRSMASFENFKSRLKIYRLDLRYIEEINRFVHHLFARKGAPFSHLDIVIHNACQTIRRPKEYYRNVANGELDMQRRLEIGKDMMRTKAIEKRVEEMKDQRSANSDTVKDIPSSLPVVQVPIHEGANSTTEKKSTTIVNIISEGDQQQRNDATEVILLPSLQSDGDNAFSGTLSRSSTTTVSNASSVYFPLNKADTHGRQLDLRPVNSWTLKLGQVEVSEMQEVMLINAIAPFHLNSLLLPYLVQAPGLGKQGLKHIINVSAMEGKFYRHKMPTHPHTNMAKAALNMMTRTCAGDLYKKHNICMNAVDTGWINDENPTPKARMTAVKNHFQTPLDEIDAASRIIDPIIISLTGERIWKGLEGFQSYPTGTPPLPLATESIPFANDPCIGALLLKAANGTRGFDASPYFFDYKNGSKKVPYVELKDLKPQSPASLVLRDIIGNFMNPNIFNLYPSGSDKEKAVNDIIINAILENGKMIWTSVYLPGQKDAPTKYLSQRLNIPRLNAKDPWLNLQIETPQYFFYVFLNGLFTWVSETEISNHLHAFVGQKKFIADPNGKHFDLGGDEFCINPKQERVTEPIRVKSDILNSYLPAPTTGDTNLACLIRANSSLVCLGRPGLGSLHADNWKDIDTYKWYDIRGINMIGEDPMIWNEKDLNNDGKEILHAVTHGGGWGQPYGFHYYSTDDGYTWESASPDTKVYSNVVQLSSTQEEGGGGDKILLSRRERPHVAIDNKGELIGLVNGVTEMWPCTLVDTPVPDRAPCKTKVIPQGTLPNCGPGSNNTGIWCPKDRSYTLFQKFKT
eukprot:g92.t1